MSLTEFVTLVAGTMGCVGLTAGFVSAVTQRPERRRRAFRGACWSFTSGGLILMLGGLAGLADQNAFFGGFMMMLFGCGASLPADRAPGSGPTREPSR